MIQGNVLVFWRTGWPRSRRDRILVAVEPLEGFADHVGSGKGQVAGFEDNMALVFVGRSEEIHEGRLSGLYREEVIIPANEQ